MTKQPRRLVSVKDALTYGKFSRTYLYRKMREGAIKGYKRNSRTVIDLDTVDAVNEDLPEWTPKHTREHEGPA